MKELYMVDYNGMWYYSLHLTVCRMSQRPDKRPWVTSQRGTICQSFLFSCYWGLLDKHYIMGLIIPRILRRQKSNPLWPPPGQCSCWLTQQLLHQTGLFSFFHLHPRSTNKCKSMFQGRRPLPYILILLLQCLLQNLFCFPKRWAEPQTQIRHAFVECGINV